MKTNVTYTKPTVVCCSGCGDMTDVAETAVVCPECYSKARSMQAYIHCSQCGKLIEAERTHNGVCACWLGHCCGFGQDAMIGEEVYLDSQPLSIKGKE